MEAEMLQLARHIGNGERLVKVCRSAADPARAKGEAVGQILLSLEASSAGKVQMVVDRQNQRRDNLIAAFALACYRLDHGPLVYRLEGSGYLLYSVGPNCVDDGGRDAESNPPGDDLCVRMPAVDPWQWQSTPSEGDMMVKRSPTRAVSPVAWIARGVAVLIAVGYLVAALVIQEGVTRWTPLLALVLLVTLALIWFPHAIGSAKRYSINRQYVDEPTPPVLISAAGWFFLVGLPLIYFLILR
jgi:hypothetical protein